MSERENRLPEDESFDALLEESLGELPPDDIAVDVSPWKKAMDRVVLGNALTLFTLNFLCLNYILPAIGTIQLLLGHRRLRRENRAFALCYAMTIIRAVIFFAALLLGATRFHGEISASPLSIILTVPGFIAQFVYIFALYRAFCAVHRKAGLSGKVDAALALVIWFVILCVLALIGYNGIIIGLIIIVAYFRIIYSLAGVSDELDGAGYSVQCAPVRVSDRALTLSVLGALTAAGLCCILFLQSYPMDWQPLKTQRGEQVERISGELAALGYPEELLVDLTDEDLLACEGAVRVYAQETHMQSFDGELIYTSGLAVELPGDGRQWRIFHHFRWDDNAKFRGTEAVDIIPVLDSSDGSVFDPDSRLGGRLLCRQNGVDCEAPFYSLTSGRYTITSIFFGGYTDTHVNAEFSLPNRAQERRGYISLDLELKDWGADYGREPFINSWMYYVHQEKLLNYPVSTAWEARQNGLGNHSVFDLVDDQLHFLP